jgi:hypothetical protein
MGGGGVAAYFDDLGRLVSKNWSGLGRRVESLAEAATLALTEMPPGPDVGALPVLEHAVGCGDLPAGQSKLSDTFGQPPLVLHVEDDFFVQALTWIDGTTDVHQHGFDGAFAVADGLSLHVPYSFQPADTLVDGHLVTGELSMERAEVLRPGDVRPIVSGFGFVHALFHLERPTLTVVVRNASSGLAYPQDSYLRPGLGIDKLWSDRRSGKRLQALRALHRLDPEAERRALDELVGSGPPWLAYLALHDAVFRLGLTDLVLQLCSILASRLPPLGPYLQPSFEVETQQASVMNRRGLLSERHHRTFLALVANLLDRPTLEAVMADLYPQAEPERLMLEWVAELSSPRYRSISGLRLTDDQQEEVRASLAQDRPVEEALGALASGVDAPVLLRDLLTV